ncbi:MAG: NAD(P)/FAD-dependent oxidoreductase, partial [Nitrososphaerales archaeon]
MSNTDRSIAVIGAGSTGASVAYHLAKMGQMVAIIDKGQPASGMTSRSTALVRNHYSNEIVVRMAHYSLQVLRNFGDVGTSGFVNNGMLFLANSEFKEVTSAVLPLLAKVGVKAEYFERQEALKRFPELRLNEDEFVEYEPESGYADPVATANSYVSKARELGAQILVGKEARKLTRDASGMVDGVEFAGGGHI